MKIEEPMELKKQLLNLSVELNRYSLLVMHELLDKIERASKYDDHQPRDDHGRWTTVSDSGNGSSGSDDVSKLSGASGMDIDETVDYLDFNAVSLRAPNWRCRS